MSRGRNWNSKRLGDRYLCCLWRKVCKISRQLSGVKRGLAARTGGLTRYHPMGKQSLEEGEAEQEAGFIYCIRVRVPVLSCV